MSAACADVTNGSAKTRQSIVSAFAVAANEAARIETVIQKILRIVRSLQCSRAMVEAIHASCIVRTSDQRLDRRQTYPLRLSR